MIWLLRKLAMAWNVYLTGTYLSDCWTSLEISVHPSVFLQASECCFTAFLDFSDRNHSSQEETEMAVFAWRDKMIFTVIFIVFLHADWSLLASLKTYNKTNTCISSQLTICAEIPLTEILCRRAFKMWMGLQNQMEGVTSTWLQQQQAFWPKAGIVLAFLFFTIHCLLGLRAVHIRNLIFWRLEMILFSSNPGWPSVSWHMDTTWAKISSADLNKPFQLY